MGAVKKIVNLNQYRAKSQPNQNNENDSLKSTVLSLMKTLELKDDYTFRHCTRVAYYSLILGREYGLNTAQLRDLELSALFHDIGKIGIADNILKKPNGLTPEEFEIMKRHPEYSAEIIAGLPGIKEEVVKSVLHHHERFDGRGYPYNLKEEAIPLYSRMIIIADTYDAMTSIRPYRSNMPSAIAYQELLEFAGSQFDPSLVKTFIRGMRREENLNLDSYFLPLYNKTFKKVA